MSVKHIKIKKTIRAETEPDLHGSPLNSTLTAVNSSWRDSGANGSRCHNNNNAKGLRKDTTKQRSTSTLSDVSFSIKNSEGNLHSQRLLPQFTTNTS